MIQVPDWSKDVIWYQIFPERFRNGCPASNPRTGDFCEAPLRGWRVSPWGMDWYRQEPWEARMGPFMKSVFSRRYGGDLAGIREKLDYLEDLGVSGIYLNPVFQAQSLHKYDASCFHHIDPSFGPDRSGDLKRLAIARETEDPDTWIWTSADLYFRELVDEIHRRGLKIIIDGVFNHTGRAFFAFRDLLANGKKSRYRDWYRIKEWGRGKAFDYEGWFGCRELPELAREGDNLAEPVRRYIAAITRRWMDPLADHSCNQGVDGWRLDVAFCVPHGFWKEWRILVKQINPQAYTTGEIVSDASAWLQGDELDAVMNYMWAYPVTRFFIRGEHSQGAAATRKQLGQLQKLYPAPIPYGLQNLLDSHDTGRILTMIANPDKPKSKWDDYFAQFRAADHPDLDTRQPGKGEKDVLRQLVLMQMTYLGAPMIYYGDEVGMWGANDPDDRQPMLWDDVVYEQEERDRSGKIAPVKRKPDKALFAFYRRAIRMRREQDALRRGTLHWIMTDDDAVLAFERRHKGVRIAVYFNVAPASRTVLPPFGGTDLWNNKRQAKKAVLLPSRGWLILRAS